jgi:hypothetical protein
MIGLEVIIVHTQVFCSYLPHWLHARTSIAATPPASAAPNAFGAQAAAAPLPEPEDLQPMVSLYRGSALEHTHEVPVALLVPGVVPVPEPEPPDTVAVFVAAPVVEACESVPGGVSDSDSVGITLPVPVLVSLAVPPEVVPDSGGGTLVALAGADVCMLGGALPELVGPSVAHAAGGGGARPARVGPSAAHAAGVVLDSGSSDRDNVGVSRLCADADVMARRARVVNVVRMVGVSRTVATVMIVPYKTRRRMAGWSAGSNEERGHAMKSSCARGDRRPALECVQG